MEESTDLTPRQIAILKAMIEEYIESAEPVGSETLEKKYSLGVSPATIRNEMVRLTDMKYLKQVHTSAGRTPTSRALKFYVDKLMKTKEMTVADEVAVKGKIWDYRQETDKFLREATKTLAERTKALALTATSEGDLYYAGAANILDMPEFYDYQLTHSLLAALDRFDFWWKLVEQREDSFEILLGEDIEASSLLSQCGFVYHKFESPNVSGAIGVVGPSRLNYPQVIPIVRYLGNLISEYSRNW
jgi:heat-inducible transcriptional repressor